MAPLQPPAPGTGGFLPHNPGSLGLEGQESSTGWGCGLITLRLPQGTPAGKRLSCHTNRRWRGTEGHSATGPLCTHQPAHHPNWKANGAQTPGEEGPASPHFLSKPSANSPYLMLSFPCSRPSSLLYHTFLPALGHPVPSPRGLAPALLLSWGLQHSSWPPHAPSCPTGTAPPLPCWKPPSTPRHARCSQLASYLPSAHLSSLHRQPAIAPFAGTPHLAASSHSRSPGRQPCIVILLFIASWKQKPPRWAMDSGEGRCFSDCSTGNDPCQASRHLTLRHPTWGWAGGPGADTEQWIQDPEEHLSPGHSLDWPCGPHPLSEGPSESYLQARGDQQWDLPPQAAIQPCSQREL